MHVHILGICGTFMGGIAALAKAAGHKVTGSDRNVYPPMSTQLKKLGVRITAENDVDQFKPAPNIVVVGNVMSRGHPLIEQLLDSGLPYTSGPQWLAQNVLQGRWVLAVAGTHGKTTTSSILAWILEYAGQKPGFLIGGSPGNFDETARYGETPFFVVEADEYDTAFFDKRAKFVHYRPRTLMLTNLEYDHADIYPDVAAIQRQFHQLVRTVPGSGRIIVNAGDTRLAEVLAMGCWTPREGYLAGGARDAALWSLGYSGIDTTAGFDLWCGKDLAGHSNWDLPGQYNLDNALAAVLAARHAGVAVETSLQALASFKGVRRRLELRGEVAGIRIFDDFAHHPTAIRNAITALRSRMNDGRLVAVLEPRSNSMKMGVHRDTLAPALDGADRIWLLRPPDLTWDLAAAMRRLGDRIRLRNSVDELVDELGGDLGSGDWVLIMSNGGFGGLHRRLLQTLQSRTARLKRLQL